ncbi:hypothetical protein GAYE_SCF23G4260 [Galdieria yellowstonensis]|uniref:Uncharacterized protein n=1 Tax=Galdieria yellowstonensis TaxID=3028027 RepID=A0AAV9IGJ5_9RHOD|nr:hypothetical protein GAYE_SCF23G4260 [Galdieria yellowstonensis]
MSTFSLGLIEKDFVHRWLMSKDSSLLPSILIDMSNGFRVKLESESLTVNLDFLACPQAVVNNIVLGQVFGDPYYFALPDTLRQTVHPDCRRFVFDLENEEFLEFHWYNSRNILLTVWMKFVTDTRLMSYFVVYDMTGNIGRRPQRVLQSKEITLQKQKLEIETPEYLDVFSSIGSGSPLFYSSEEIERRLEAIPQAREFVRKLLGSFEGVMRTSEFELNTFKLLNSSQEPCQLSIFCREPAEDIKRRERSRLCMPPSLFPNLPILREDDPLNVVEKLLQYSMSDMEKLDCLLSGRFSETLPGSPSTVGLQHMSIQDSSMGSASYKKMKKKSYTDSKRVRKILNKPSMRMQQRYEATETQLLAEGSLTDTSSLFSRFPPYYEMSTKQKKDYQEEEQQSYVECESYLSGTRFPNDCFFHLDSYDVE